jgi:hypothetical protein
VPHPPTSGPGSGAPISLPPATSESRSLPSVLVVKSWVPSARYVTLSTAPFWPPSGAVHDHGDNVAGDDVDDD